MNITPVSPTPPPARKPESDPRRALGAAGEAMAARALEQAGLRILERNWRCTGQGLPGEIDLVAEEIAPDLTAGGMPVPWRVVVEVRTRRGSTYGTALQSVTETKARRLRALGAAWVQERDWQGPWRIDVVAIQMDASGRLLEM
ncbi:MAG: YraN family protein, partial [Caldilineaceae bacterium]